jgi:hypothetical protein
LISPKIVRDQIRMSLSRTKMRIQALSLGLAVKEYVCNRGEKDNRTLSTGTITDQELKKSYTS